MALSAEQLQDAFAIATQDIYDNIEDIFTRANPTLTRVIKNKRKVDGGTFLQFPVAGVSEVTSQGFIPGGANSVLSFNPEQLITFGTLNWKYWYQVVAVTLKDMNETLDTKRAIRDMLTAKVDFAKGSMMRNLSTALHGSSVGDVNTWNGFGDMFAASGVAYMGLLNTDIPNWLPQLDTTTTTSNYTNISGMLDLIKSFAQQDGVSKKYKQDLLVSNYTVYNNFKTAEQLKLRFNNISDDLMKAGFSGINVDGADWVVDADCAASTLYALTTHTLQLAYKYGFGSKSQFDSERIQLPQAPVAGKLQFVTGNVAMINRRVNGKFSGLTA